MLIPSASGAGIGEVLTSSFSASSQTRSSKIKCNSPPIRGQVSRKRDKLNYRDRAAHQERAAMGDNNSISGVEPIEPDKILPPSRC